MFLNENPTNIFFQESTSDPAYMYDAILEANEAYHDLCMKMVKCEHACIVNENTEMLEEAAGDFKEKVSKIANTLLAKFMAFIDRVRAEWSKLWAGVLSKLVDADKVKAMSGLISSKTFKVEGGVDINGLRNANKLYDKVVSIANNRSDLDKVINEINAVMPKDTDNLVTVNAEVMNTAIAFLKERPKMIKDLERIKANGKMLYKVDANNNETKPDGMLIAKYSSIMSKVIVRINKSTAAAVKILRAVLKKEQSNEKYGEYNKAYKAFRAADKQREKEAKKANNESASILDMFE